MTDRAFTLVTLAVGLVLVGVQVAVKPRPTPKDVQQVADFVVGPQQWRGRFAPDFDLPLLDGSTFHLADHVGREVVILNFFATWCGPCRREMPELQRYVDGLAGQRVVLIAIDVEEKRPTVEALVKEERIRLPIALDESGDTGAHYGVSALPTTVVVGADGRIAYYETGGMSNAEVALGAIVRPQAEAIAAIAANPGVAREAYEAGLRQQAKGGPPEPPAEPPLTGRARRIAEAMPCPCGCTQKVSECTCQTAQAIKARLRAGGYDDKTDAEVMQALNREFCMKGM